MLIIGLGLIFQPGQFGQVLGLQRLHIFHAPLQTVQFGHIPYIGDHQADLAGFIKHRGACNHIVFPDRTC